MHLAKDMEHVNLCGIIIKDHAQTLLRTITSPQLYMQ
jgi:hypothetical protein